jgi:hypothetical protein
MEEIFHEHLRQEEIAVARYLFPHQDLPDKTLLQ